MKSDDWREFSKTLKCREKDYMEMRNTHMQLLPYWRKNRIAIFGQMKSYNQSKSTETLNRYAAIRSNIKAGVYNKENFRFWERIFRIIYSDNYVGIYREIYLFNKRIYCKLVCWYIYN